MKQIVFVLMAGSLLTACANTSATEKPQATILETLETNKPIQKTKASIVDYIKLKDVFVKSDAKAASEAAAQLSKSLVADGMSKDLIKAADAIAASSDLEAQRKSFKVITDKLIEYVKANGSGQTVFVQYCPMAFGNTGASWLSDSKEVLNPYFGNRMLRCGTVKEVIN
jgi:hypothetical protein